MEQAGQGSPLQRKEKGNWIILLAVGVFLSLRTTDESSPPQGGWGVAGVGVGDGLVSI